MEDTLWHTYFNIFGYKCISDPAARYQSVVGSFALLLLCIINLMSIFIMFWSLFPRLFGLDLGCVHLRSFHHRPHGVTVTFGFPCGSLSTSTVGHPHAVVPGLRGVDLLPGTWEAPGVRPLYWPQPGNLQLAFLCKGWLPSCLHLSLRCGRLGCTRASGITMQDAAPPPGADGLAPLCLGVSEHTATSIAWFGVCVIWPQLTLIAW